MSGTPGRVPASSVEALRRSFRAGWRRTMAEWSRDGADDRFWLVGAANYLFRTGTARWALDISFKNASVFDELSPTLAQDLDRLDFVLVTHAHRDHFDTRTVRALRDLPATWVIPHFMAPLALGEAGLSEDRMLLARPGEKIELAGLRIDAFPGLHWEASGTEGTDSLGFLVDTGRTRALFPGDVRTFEGSRIPTFGGVAELFAHVWLGRDKALDGYPAAGLERFADFVVSLEPERVNLTHLYETDRKPEQTWTYAHAGMVMDVLCARAPELEVRIPGRWRSYPLGG